MPKREAAKRFDISPFALPNHPENEFRFEEPRDVTQVVVTLWPKAPARLGLSYLRGNWPHKRVELFDDLHEPARFGWLPMDDHFNTVWQGAAVVTRRLDLRKVAMTFQGLVKEFPEFRGHDERDVAFRRTLGIRIESLEAAKVRKVEIHTASQCARMSLRLELDAGKKTPTEHVRISGYNAHVRRVLGLSGARLLGGRVLTLGSAKTRAFRVDVEHMRPAHRYCYDDGLLTFVLDRGTFTISLTSLVEQGPVWFAEQGVFIAQMDDLTSFADYRARHRQAKTVAERVLEEGEQSFGGARHCQPRPHPEGFSIGCKGSRHRFWVEPNGDIVLHGWYLKMPPGKDTGRFLNDRHARFFFGLERWCTVARFTDPPPVLAYNVALRRDALVLEQKSLAVPLGRSILAGGLAGDDTVVALVRFLFHNRGSEPVLAELPVSYSSKCGRSFAPLLVADRDPSPQNADMVPESQRDELEGREGQITSRWDGRPVLRATHSTSMTLRERGSRLLFARELKPDESCEFLLKIPYIALERGDELKALDALEFPSCYADVRAFWQNEGRRGAQVHTPEPCLDAAYKFHLPIVDITDFEMPDGSGLINTSVGTSTYRNFPNEACMVQEELDQRGLHEEARKRVEIYVKYQGKGKILGNFTDFQGLYFASGGFESGSSYNQHHGWVMWRLADHYFMTGDDEWLRGVAGSLVAAADWVFRQRRNTMKKLPHSRGWEYGFLPAGGLEDVRDYHYWLVNNAMSWRGTEWAARALEAIGHPEAARIRKESDACRRDLIRGFETARQHAPLVRLRDGRWVPHYPSRLYCRGRDVGWIRETLEGSVYLLLSGLYEAKGRRAGWILDDYLDNRYASPPYGYALSEPAAWFARGGFSIQPNLLAGLLPYLDRDEPEVYIWMFFNAWTACYREEISAMVEHPMPELGFSNRAAPKTSDQSNAMKWLVYMFVCTLGETLHFGRAIPRDWLRHGSEIWVRDVGTHFGRVGVTYLSEAGSGRISAELRLDLRRRPRHTVVRFRHPEKKPMLGVTVNSRPHADFDPVRGDVDITGLTGAVQVIASYG